MLRSTRLAAVAALACILTAGSAAHAKFTTVACLVQKHIAWDKFRQCQRKVQVRQLQGKPADSVTCQTKFQDTFAKINDKATKAAIACRYGDNGDGTVTDYDTGLQWEKKSALPGLSVCGRDDQAHCVFDTFTFFEAAMYVNASHDGSVRTDVFDGFAGYSDWRLPSITELQTILLAPYPCATSPCIDSAFGRTAADAYWSATTSDTLPGFAWALFFDDGHIAFGNADASTYVRAVRTGL